VKILSAIVLGVAAFFLHLWSALALYYNTPSAWRLVVVIGYGLGILGWIVMSRKKRRAMALSLLVFLAVAIWFTSIKPPKNPVYPPELALTHVEVNGDLVTLRGVRNCDYRTKDDFDVRYETRTYDLRELKTLDVMVNYWGINAIAHTFVSYGFSDGRYLAVSVEIRPEVGEAYGMFNGLYKQYELIYIWGDERDLVRLRTNYKKEDVYLYRMAWTRRRFR
jgi:hypothetical protein